MLSFVFLTRRSPSKVDESESIQNGGRQVAAALWPQQFELLVECGVVLLPARFHIEGIFIRGHQHEAVTAARCHFAIPQLNRGGISLFFRELMIFIYRPFPTIFREDLIRSKLGTKIWSRM